MRQKRILQLSLLMYVLFMSHAFPGNAGKNAAPEPVVSKIIVEIQDAAGDESRWTEIAENLIFLKEGEPFSAQKLQESLEALKLCRKFQTINADSDDGKYAVKLFFRLKPFRQVKDIQIISASPLFERDILNVMTFYIGDAFVGDQLKKQAELIENIFKEEGFIRPEVNVSAQEDPADGHFIVYVNIEKGEFYRVGNFEIKGNLSFSGNRLKVRMKTWQASLLPGGLGRFIEKNLKEDIKNLTGYYRKKGYSDAVIDSQIERNAETGKAAILIRIDEGMVYDIGFDGNKEFWDMTLKKDIVLFKEGNKNDSGIKKSVKNIKERYRAAGYPEADVTVKEEVIGETRLRKLRFVIAEGPRSLVESVRITGNEQFDSKKIGKQMLTRPPGILNDGACIPETLEDDADAVKTLYLNKGYRDTQVKKKVSGENRALTVALEIEEGIQTLVSSVKVKGLNVLSEEEAYKILRVKSGEPLLEDNIREDEIKLASLVSEKGYPHIKVSGEFSLSEDHSKADVTYTVEEGPYVEMGQVYFTGNFRTRRKILLNELEIKPQAPFSLVKLLETQRNFRNMNIFESVQFKAFGLKEKADKVNLFVELEEKKPYFAQVGVGYDTRRNLYANALSGDRNLFGLNKSVQMSGEISQIGYQAGLGITEPRLFASRVSSSFELFATKTEELNKDFGTKSFGSSLGFSRKWFEHLNTNLTFRFEQREQFRRNMGTVSADVFNEEELETRRFLVTTPYLSYDTRDSFVRPRKGMFSSASVDISQGFENSMDNFLKYQIDARYYWTPFSRLTFAWHGRMGHIEPFGSVEKVPDDQLFFLGGISDIRGFSENMLRYNADNSPVGGHTSLLGSMEARIDLGLNFELTTFYDAGKLSNVFQNTESEGFRSAVGMGLRYITPVGPIGFLYGVKLGPEQGESSGRLHFSLGYTF